MTISHRRRPPTYIQRSKAAALANGGKVHTTKTGGGVDQYSIKRIALVATSFIVIYLLLQKKGGSAVIEQQQQQIHNAIISSSIQNGTSNIQQSQQHLEAEEFIHHKLLPYEAQFINAARSLSPISHHLINEL